MVKLRNENSLSYSLTFLRLITELQLKETGFRSNVFAFFPTIVRFVPIFNNQPQLHSFRSVEFDMSGGTAV